jgi:hypothetical protein
MNEDFEAKENQPDMKKWSKPAFLLTLLITATVTAAGCSDDSKAKTGLEQALAKQTEMKAYSFNGTADLKIDLPAPKAGQNPLTSTFLNMLLQSKLEWSGAASTEPIRFEADIKSTPAGSQASLDLPVILKDNKLYLHIPMLNKTGEFYSIDMAELSKLSGQASPLSPDSLKNITKTVSETVKLAIADVDPKWFKQTAGTTLKDGTKATSYRLDITDKNRAEIETALRAKLPLLAEQLKASGLLTQTQADEWKARSGTFSLKSPGYIAAAVDETGFIREQSVNFSISYQGSDSKEHSTGIQFTQAYNSINQEPKWNKQEPQNARPLSEILKLLMPSSAGK